jgi:hypothetical protein
VQLQEKLLKVYDVEGIFGGGADGVGPEGGVATLNNARACGEMFS